MNHVAKVIEVIGTSDQSIEDAIHGSIARANETIEGMQWFEVTEVRGAIKDGKVERFQVMMKIGFAVND